MNERTNFDWDNNDTPYEMPEPQGRNVIIFSDGTGQAGGIMPDEVRSNVYKLYRATRTGPESNVDPDKQITFYDPGLGSKLGDNGTRITLLRRLYNALSSATGLGISKNIEDCYAALIQLWRPGDRIFLFGFSRGAYTVRCLGGVLTLCGIPTRLPGRENVLRDPATIREIAREAVHRVYRHGSGASEAIRGDPSTEQPSSNAVRTALTRKNKLAKQREALGAQFRRKYDSAGPIGPNVVPHFIGVWDTVAAVGLSRPAYNMVRLAALAATLLFSAGGAWWMVRQFNVEWLLLFVGMFVAIFGAGYLISIVLRLKFVTGLPEHPWYKTIHLTSLRMKFFDRSLHPHVRYARHAIAIDETRAEFDRVPWINDGTPPNRELAEGPWFIQYWFAGNHSDIGGSYAENESRLSDIALKWMVNHAEKAGLVVDDQYSHLFGRHHGPQHDETRVGIRLLGMTFKWRTHVRKMVDCATIHPSVRARFDELYVPVYDEEKPYRPELLRNHVDYKDTYITEEAELRSAQERMASAI